MITVEEVAVNVSTARKSCSSQTSLIDEPADSTTLYSRAA